MIIRRQLYPQNKIPVNKSQDSGIEMKAIYNKKAAHPCSTVNKLINTASTGTSIVRDVDTLLTPIHELHHRDEQNYTREQQLLATKERTERNLWRNDEVMEMLYTMQQVKALEKLNDKTVKSENVFKDVEALMHKNGYVKKSHVQIWTKWKFLKSTYMTSRRNGFIPRMVPPQIYDKLHQMISGINLGFSDCGNSTNGSIDGDASSANGGMVISGVEGGIPDAANGEDDDSFGMAHPIFGFRLGLVKSEPADTGYDATENTGSDNDPLDEQASLSKSDKQLKEESNNTDKSTVPHRGRGRPPKHPPAATSTPNTTPATSSSPQMPPLRVAPFAKTVHSANAFAASRPPPPLTMPPTPRIQVANLSNMKNVQRKLLPKPEPSKQSPVGQAVRVSKEIVVQSRSSTSPSPGYPKMKQIPMRKTPYSLRPDRAIPDLDASLSPPPPAIEKMSSKKFEEVPSTKHLIMQSNANNNLNNAAHRKRRLEFQEPMPSKQPKYRDIEEDEDEEVNTKSENIDDGKHYGNVLQNVIIDLSTSLRKMQTQMMRDFFNKQNELLQKEHEFQLQQDRMIMRAFQQQTQEIMLSVKQLVGTITNNSNGNSKIAQQAKTNRKCRLPPKQGQQQDVEEEQNTEVQEVEEEQEQEEQDHEMEHEQDEIYSDGEEQQEQIEDQEENENDQQEEQEDDEAVQAVDIEDSDDAEQDPIQMVSSELTED